MGGSNSLYIIIWVAIFIGIFYFLLVRPQRRQRQAQTELETLLKKGDEVLTRAGLYGTITKVGDTWVELEIAKRTRVRFLKAAIGSITTISEDVEEDEEPIDEDEVIEEEGEEEYEDVAEEESEEEWGEGDEEWAEAEEDEGEEEAPEAPTPPPAPKA